jgi:hypothetical protein
MKLRDEFMASYFVHVSEEMSQMNPFDSCSQMSVAVMENCFIHHTEDVAEIFPSVGILLIYCHHIYGPNTSPIELAFGYVRAYLKELQDLLIKVNNFHSGACPPYASFN